MIDREHIELFPNKRSLPRDIVEKLNEMVMHALAGGQNLPIALRITRITHTRKHYFRLVSSAFWFGRSCGYAHPHGSAYK